MGVQPRRRVDYSEIVSNSLVSLGVPSIRCALWVVPAAYYETVSQTEKWDLYNGEIRRISGLISPSKEL